jgi:glycosyltransferase involved in cell wall biosynthesis
MTASPVTVIIPTYLQADCVAGAIASALAQTHPGLEVLVMDDASPDETPAVAERFHDDPRLRVVRNQANLGRVANYREGLRLARGEWVLVLDGDDVLLDADFVSVALRHASADPAVVLVVGGQRFHEAQGGRFRDRYPTKRPEEHLDGWRFFLRWRSPRQVVPHLASLYRADLARTLGFYAHDIASSDWESLRRLCLRGRVVLLRRLAGEWRGHGGNVSRTLDPRAHLDNLAAILVPYDDARRTGHGGWRLRLWKWDALRRYVAMYLEAALSQGGTAAAREFGSGLGARVGRAGAAFLLGVCYAGGPSLWLKLALHALGGPRLLAAARRAWQRATWSRHREAGD